MRKKNDVRTENLRVFRAFGPRWLGAPCQPETLGEVHPDQLCNTGISCIHYTITITAIMINISVLNKTVTRINLPVINFDPSGLNFTPETPLSCPVSNIKTC